MEDFCAFAVKILVDRKGYFNMPKKGENIYNARMDAGKDATFAEEKTTVPFMDMFMVKHTMR